MLSRKRKTKACGVAILAASCLFFVRASQVPAAEGGKAATLAELIGGAKKETTLRAQWGADTLDGGPGLQKIVAGMNKKYGLNLQPSFTPGPNMQGMMTKIAREVAAGQPASSDVYFGNPQSMLQAIEAKALMPMNWTALLERKLAPEGGFDPIVPGNIGIAMASTLVGAVYNSNLVKGDDVPRKLDDFLNPKWKGKIASTPYAAGLREFAMPELLGRERIIEFTKKLSKHIGGLMRCGETDRLTSGEFLMLVLACGDQEVNIAQRKGIPLGYAILDEATLSHTRYAGVPKNSRSPNAAALFIIYLHTVEGQKLMWDIDGLDFHLYPESNQKKKLDAAKARGAKFVVSSPQWLQKHKDYEATQKELEKILRGEGS
ncbi:MAG TPA: extracellular solute-binding protein [Candidatus Acidoferrales bacterium]|nr:extracellular solute-binding protein [Candidatus Acidoferrales bacterium]